MKVSSRSMGCDHYRRGCRLVCPDCDQEHWCRFCHDEATTAGPAAHALDRARVTQVACGHCGKRQAPSTHCFYCNLSFGRYICFKCNLFDDDDTKGQFHCEGCGSCRTGGRDNFVHCHTCGFCIQAGAQGSHHHVADALGRVCLLCGKGPLMDSTQALCVMKECGHALHVACVEGVQGEGLRAPTGHPCPVCFPPMVPAGASSAQGLMQRLTLDCAATSWVDSRSVEAVRGVEVSPGLGGVFQELAARVRPGAAELADARRAVKLVVTGAVHRLQGVGVDRVCVSGSVGRGTALRGAFDVDLVMIINQQVTQPIRQVVFAEVAGLLRRVEGVEQVHSRGTPGQQVMQFSVRTRHGGMLPFDLGIAQNLVPSHQQLRTPREVAELQVRSVLRGIQEQGRPQHRREDDFNVCEAVRALIAAAPGQVNDAVRLAKAWAKHLHQEEGRFPNSTRPPPSGTRPWPAPHVHDPVVVHPCNPTNNMCLTARGFVDWGALGQAASRQLRTLREGSDADVLGSPLGRAVAATRE